MFIIISTPIICMIVFSIVRSCSSRVQTIATPTPANSIIVFDIHGVLLKHNYRAMWHICCQSPYTWQLIALLLKPRFVYRMSKAYFTHTLAQTLFTYMAEQTIKPEVWQLFVAIANCQRINEPVVALAQSLKKSGYQLAILSNISNDLFINLAPHYPELFALFDPIITSCAEKDFITKPQRDVYTNLMQQFAQHDIIMFIDDNQKNICGSLPFGIVALKYHTIEQLKKDLAAHGLRFE